MPSKVVPIGDRQLVFDARPDRLDVRDRPYAPRLANLPDRFPLEEDLGDPLARYVAAGLVLDQGEDGACTGFGLAAVVNYLLFKHGAEPESVSPAMLYRLARLYDEWPGEDYEGSSCRGALKGWQRHGVCRASLWPYSSKKAFSPHEDAHDRASPAKNWDVDALARTLGVYYRIDSRSVVDMQSAIVETGAIYVSGTVHEGWDVPTKKRLRSHADLARIRHVPKPKDAGGHAFALVGYDEHGFVVQNSWGKGWGTCGFALLPYEDWVSHGDDAWVLTMGVSRQHAGLVPTRRRGAPLAPARTPRFFIPSSAPGDATTPDRPIGLVGASDALARRLAGLPAKLRPLEPDDAYRHALVMDRGFPVRTDIAASDPARGYDVLAREWPLAYQRARSEKKLKLLIYAHGGLNSEAASIQRIRLLAPYALDAGLYPLFLTWRSGPLETLSDMVEEVVARMGFGARGEGPARGWLDRLSEKTDRLIEPLVRAPGGALWSQMKLNAVRASENGQGAGRLLVKSLAKLAAETSLELHFMGHSAGAILIGGLLDRLREAELPVASLRLFAPACTTRFALDHYVRAVEAKILPLERWKIHVLSDENEQADAVGPYRKSLLYLVSRAFEEEHKTPLLGLARSFDPASLPLDLWSDDGRKDVEEWLAFWNAKKRSTENPIVLEARNVSNGAKAIAASHGCFDNAIGVMSEALSFAAGSTVRVRRLDE